jgi:hypothetical protein
LGFETLAFAKKPKDPIKMEVIENIKQLAAGRFDEAAFKEFLERFIQLSSGSEIIGSILQISTDEGDELEIGFFTSDLIADITLSRGKVYSCSYPLSKVENLHLSDNGSKTTLTVSGEKKFDYNVVKPGSVDVLKKYEISLRRHLSLSCKQ